MSVDTESYYRRYGPMVLRRCRRLLGDEERARDAMHDVFVQLLRHRATLADSAPSSLLFRIATNVCLNLLRGDRRHPETRDDELLQRIANSDDVESATGARRVLARLFASDQESTRTIAVLHFYDQMTLEEVAAEVGLSVSGVRKRIRRLRERLPGLTAEGDAR